MENSWAFGGHIACWQLCRGPHDVFDLEIPTSSGNGLCNVARSEVDLQKRSLPLQHLHTIALLQASLIRNRVLRHAMELISKYKKVYLSSVACVKRFKRFFEDKRCNTAEIASRAALKGSEGREFDTTALQHACCKKSKARLGVLDN